MCYVVLYEVPDSSAVHKMVRRHLNLDGLKQHITPILLKIILFLLRKSIFLAGIRIYSDLAGRPSDTGSTPYFLCAIKCFLELAAEPCYKFYSLMIAQVCYESDLLYQ